MAKGATRSNAAASSSPNKSASTKTDTSTRRSIDEKSDRKIATPISSPAKSIKSPESTTASTKSSSAAATTTSTPTTTRKRKSSLLDDRAQHQEIKASGIESKVEPKSSVISSPQSTAAISSPPSSTATTTSPSLFAKSQSIGSTKSNKSSSIECRPIAEESSEPSKFSPSKREAHERLRSPIESSVRTHVQSLEQEINERKAEFQSSTNTTATTTNTSSSSISGGAANSGIANKSKLSDALDKLFCKQKEKEQQQQQKQLQRGSKQSKRLSSHSIEERIKSPVDMDIEPKELNEREDVKINESRTKYASRGDDVQKQSLAGNDTCNLTAAAAVAAGVTAVDPSSIDSDDQLRPSTNKYEQEQFVNNMPKPPTPKSSMIFSPPPTSLTIDKRESIFDFAENFSITNDTSVSLLSFNSESIFKEDSAKETMDLVANLRQNIKKGGKADECARATSTSSSAATKAEPVGQTPAAGDTNASPDSTTIDANVKNSNTSAEHQPMSLKSMDAKSKAAAIAALQQPTLVIDLDQENSSDESKPPTMVADEPVSIPSSTAQKSMTHKDTNWIQSAHAMEKERGANLMNMMQQQQQQIQPTQMQHQTEVEQIASKMPGHIQTPADMLAENELNEAQNMNAFHVQQPYANNAFNGNKETFDRALQIQVMLLHSTFIYNFSNLLIFFYFFIFAHSMKMSKQHSQVLRMIR